MSTESTRHRNSLEQKRSATERRITSLTRSFEEIVQASGGQATDDEHDPEGHTIAWERQQIAALLEEARETLAELAEAETRLDDGNYGSCVDCGRNISAQRLEALPATPVCVSCAT